jgi:hypothetical protein
MVGDMTDSPRFKPVEAKVEALAVDTTGAPLITQCPATGCEDLDLTTMEGAGGRVWIVACGSGHMAFISRKEDQ